MEINLKEGPQQEVSTPPVLIPYCSTGTFWFDIWVCSVGKTLCDDYMVYHEIYKTKIKALSNHNFHLSRGPSHYSNSNQKANYSLYQSLKQQFGPIWVWLLTLHNTLFFFFLCSWMNMQHAKQKPIGIYGTFYSMAEALMYYMLTHHFYHDFCQMKKKIQTPEESWLRDAWRGWRVGLWKPGMHLKFNYEISANCIIWSLVTVSRD